MTVDRNDQYGGNSKYHIFACSRNQRDPDGGDQYPAVELIRIGVFIGIPSSVNIAKRHGDHNRADNNRPDDLGRTKIRRQQTACAKLDRHYRHSGKKLGQIQIPFLR